MSKPPTPPADPDTRGPGGVPLDEDVDLAAEEPEPETNAIDEQLLRALADLDNLRKRFHREMARELAGERARVAREFLPVVDNLELALAHAGEMPPGCAALVDGVRAVRDQAVAALARLGFTRFDDAGAPFDPARHEAVGAIPSDSPPGTVVAVTRPGYGAGESLLRPASVVVSRDGS